MRSFEDARFKFVSSTVERRKWLTKTFSSYLLFIFNSVASLSSRLTKVIGKTYITPKINRLACNLTIKPSWNLFKAQFAQIAPNLVHKS